MTEKGGSFGGNRMDIEIVNEQSAQERKRLEVIQELLSAEDRATMPQTIAVKCRQTGNVMQW